MKQILPLLFLAFSMSAFAQNNPVRPHLKDPKSKMIQASPDKESKLNKLHPDREYAKELKRLTRELFTDIQEFDSIYYWDWDTFSTDWVLVTKATDITYNQGGYITSISYQNLEAGIWEYSAQLISTFDGNNNELSRTYKSWNGTFFQNVYQDVFTYDAHGNQTSDVFQIWNGTAWVNYSRYLYVYDGNNNLTSATEQDWNGTSFDNYGLYTYTYDANNNRTSELIQSWNDVDLIWENTDRSLFTYDAHDNLITSTYQIWNETIVDWDNQSLYTYTYDANDREIKELYQYWDGAQWANSNQYTITWNADDEVTNTFTQVWNTTNWENSARATYTYNANHQLIRFVNENWNGSWVPSVESNNTYGEGDFLESHSNRFFDADGVLVASGDSTFNFFHTVNTGINEVANNEGNLSVFPNPGTGKITITSKDALHTLSVYNLLGELMYTTDEAKGQTSTEMDLGDYGKGIYIITAADGTKTYNRKVVVQ